MSTKSLLTVEEIWRSFWNVIKPKGQVSDVQRIETRRAFYAGFHTCLCQVRETVGTEEMDEEAGVAYLQALHEECQAFQLLMKQRKA